MTERIQLAHGGGGRLTRELIETHILPRFGKGPLEGLPDGARLPGVATGLVFTTDSFVVQPILFPGGNIGHLAVHGTVNDVAVCGARPRWLSVSMILEEGLAFETLDTVLDAIAEASADCGVQVVTGDTKVVPCGFCDGVYLTTAGIGEPLAGFDLSPQTIREGDLVIASGTLGDHGFAVLAARSGIGLVNGPTSDTAPVHRLVQAIMPVASAVRFMRDPTRGGTAAVLTEIASAAGLDMLLDEAALPLSSSVRATSELLGLDPLHVASEGRFLLVCDPTAANELLAAIRALPEGTDACIIGRAVAGSGRVVIDTLADSRRLVTIPRGDLLPRIC